MQIYRGQSVFGGVAIGKIRVYLKERPRAKWVKIENIEEEISRFGEARLQGISELQALYEKALQEVGEAEAAIFQAHQMMLADAGYYEFGTDMIKKQRVCAEYAVHATGEHFAQIFALAENVYMKERVADIRDISERMLTILSSEDQREIKTEEPIIVLADDLTPSETIQLGKYKVQAFVTVQGSLNSHTAILTRAMAIPALVNTMVPLQKELDGKMGIVDGTGGVIYVDPDEETLAVMQQKRDAEEEKALLLQQLKGKENISLDGQKMVLSANISNMKDLVAAVSNDAEGIGLFRSEFIYLEKADYPTEEELFQIYKQVISSMAGKRVTIRTLDIGADKGCEYFKLEKEANPALGYRGIRICLTRPELFKTQLRALYRASAYGKLAIMYPMITSVKEVRQIKEITEQVKKELKEQGMDFGEPEQGITIETPAAVMISEELAKEVDFFSIGTNDLTQYTLAIDRQNPKLDGFYDPYHPSVFRMISMIVESARKAGIRVGICGELGADPALTKAFLAMGIEELSVSPASILPLRKIVRETKVNEYKKSGKYFL